MIGEDLTARTICTFLGSWWVHWTWSTPISEANVVLQLSLFCIMGSFSSPASTFAHIHKSFETFAPQNITRKKISACMSWDNMLLMLLKRIHVKHAKSDWLADCVQSHSDYNAVSWSQRWGELALFPEIKLKSGSIRLKLSLASPIKLYDLRILRDLWDPHLRRQV